MQKNRYLRLFLKYFYGMGKRETLRYSSLEELPKKVTPNYNMIMLGIKK
jgi:hypothetical protein